MRQYLGFGGSAMGSCSENLRQHPPGAWLPKEPGIQHGFDPVMVTCPSPKGQAEEVEEEQTGSGQELGCS